jgi:hypothetical protein
MKSNPEIQTHFMGFFGAKVDGISSTQAHPLNRGTMHENSNSESVASLATPRVAPRFMRKLAFTAEETRHHYAIEALEKPGSFRPQPYLYTCVRCRWIFRVNDSRGSIIALDGLGRHLPEPENAKRIVTFHRGPCPAFPVFEYLVPEVDRESLLPRYLSRVVEVLRGLTDVGRNRTRTRRQGTTTAYHSARAARNA